MTDHHIDLSVFPKDFIWATATAAYQIEGASDVDGRGESTWDEVRRIPDRIYDNSDPSVSCEGYAKYKEDVQLLKELGVTHYRFSISWTRIFPNGKKDSVNEKGIQFYRMFCEELLKNGIEPIVTLFHCDYPLALYKEGSWLNEKAIEWFTDFSEYVFENLGDLVKIWLTFNEIPMHAWSDVVKCENQCDFSLDMDLDGTGFVKRQVPYVVGHRMILAHARVYHLYHERFAAGQNGRVGIVAGPRWAVTDDTNARNAQERMFDWNFRWTVEPICGTGDYPESMKTRLSQLAQKEGLPYILPEFTPEEKKLVKGTVDFLGINYYLVFQIGNITPENSKNCSLQDFDGDYAIIENDFEKISGDTWVRNTPFGLHKGLQFIRDHYDNIPVLITENGCADILPATTDPLRDSHRIKYMRGHIEAVGKALTEKCNVIGYTAWSLMDNFEWADGFGVKFGLYRVDFDSAEKTRTPKDSAKFYGKLVDDWKKKKNANS